jgi:SAM-dependent methyltransferase
MGTIHSKRRTGATPQDFYVHNQAAVPSDGTRHHRSSMATSITLYTESIPEEAYACAHDGQTSCPLCYTSSLAPPTTKRSPSGKSMYGDHPSQWSKADYASSISSFTEGGLSSVHYLFKAVTGRPHLAPLERPAVALCVGNGTHAWLAEMANHYHAATWYALDTFSPEAATAAAAKTLGLPPNCRVHHPIKSNVRVNGVESSLLARYPTSHFDYVHQRLNLLTIPTSHWRGHLKELARVTRPGGYLELSEISLLPDANAGRASRKLAHVLKQFLLNAYGVDPLASQAEIELLGEPESHDSEQEAGLRATMVTQCLQVLAVRKYNVPIGYCPPSVLVETLPSQPPSRSDASLVEMRERHASQVQKMGKAILSHYKKLYTQWAEEIIALGWLPEEEKQHELWRAIREWEREMLTVGGWTQVLVVVARRKVQSSETTRLWT